MVSGDGLRALLPAFCSCVWGHSTSSLDVVTAARRTGWNSDLVASDASVRLSSDASNRVMSSATGPVVVVVPGHGKPARLI
jgi:hypothetical protein